MMSTSATFRSCANMSNPQDLPNHIAKPSIAPHLVVDDATAAIAFYERAFGAETLARLDGPDGSVMHAELRVGQGVFFLADVFPMGPESPRGLGGSPVGMHLYVDDADAVFARAVEAGAEGTMPVMEAFWGDRYGQVTDPFGHRWGLAHQVREMSLDEIRAAGEDWFRKHMK